MSTTKTLSLGFLDSDGKSVTQSYSYAKSTLTDTVVNDFMDTIIANGSIFVRPPVSKKSAAFITREKEEFEINA